MRTPAKVGLSKNDRETLESWVRKGTTEARLRERARIILLCADGFRNDEIAEKLDIHQTTASTWRTRFLSGGIDALGDAPRSGRPTVLKPEVEKRLVDLTLTPPPNRTHWSLRHMARIAGVKSSTVRQVWAKHDLKPHIVRTFKLSKDPEFEEKVEDIVGLYLNPPDRAIVLSMDEKSQIQALDRSRPILPIRPGLPEHQSHDYKRHGTTTLFAALNVQNGEVIGQLHERHRAIEFIAFLDEIDVNTPKERDLHIIIDNYQTHKTKEVKEWLANHPRFVLHFTPTGSSWINMVERLFGKLTEERIRRGVFKSVPELNKAITDWLDAHNENPKPFRWTAKAADIIRKVGKYQRIYRTLH